MKRSFLQISLVILAGSQLRALPPDATSARELFRLGDRLARELKYSEALDTWRQAYLLKLPQYRGMPFLHEVKADIMPRGALKERMLEEFAKEYPEDELQRDRAALVRFGFLKPELDLKETMLQLYAEQIAGFYDPDTKQLYLIKEDGSRKKSLLEALVGGSDFSPSEQKTVLAHELSHALMDQYFDLFSLHRSREGDEDASLALSALIEGEATLSMIVDQDGGDGRSLLRQGPAGAELLFNLVMGLGLGGGGEVFDRAPNIIKDTLLFPYMKGLSFCWEKARAAGGSWQGVNEMFLSPPLSTEQILHPEKFGGPGADDPVDLLPSGPSPLEKAGWKLVKTNVLGELQTEILLRRRGDGYASVRAAAGWDGDRYWLHADPAVADRSCLVWVSAWDSPEDAEELAALVRKHFSARRHGGVVVERRGTLVLCVVGAPAEADLARDVLDWARRARPVPKRIAFQNANPSVQFPGERTRGI